MSFALPESMREYIDNRVAAGNYGNTSEYIRDLVRRDQEEQAKKRLRHLIEEGLASGPGRRRTKGGREGTAGDRSRRDRLKPAELRPQALRDQQGEVRYYRKEGGSSVAVKVAKATKAALDQIELDPGIGSPTLGKLLGIPGLRSFGPGGSESFRCCGSTSSAGNIWMWSDCWASAKTSPRSWATSSPRTDGTRVEAEQGRWSTTGLRQRVRRDGRRDPTHGGTTDRAILFQIAVIRWPPKSEQACSRSCCATAKGPSIARGQ